MAGSRSGHVLVFIQHTASEAGERHGWGPLDQGVPAVSGGFVGVDEARPPALFSSLQHVFRNTLCSRVSTAGMACTVVQARMAELLGESMALYT